MAAMMEVRKRRFRRLAAEVMPITPIAQASCRLDARNSRRVGQAGLSKRQFCVGHPLTLFECSVGVATVIAEPAPPGFVIRTMAGDAPNDATGPAR